MSRSTRVVVVVEDRWAEVSSGQGRRLEMPEMRGWAEAGPPPVSGQPQHYDGLTSGPGGSWHSHIQICEMQQRWQIQWGLMGAFSRASVLSLGSFIRDASVGPAWGWCPARPGLGELWAQGLFVMMLVIHLLQTKNHRCVLPPLPFIWYQQCRLGGANGCSLEIISVKCFIVMQSAELILKVHFIR